MRKICNCLNIRYFHHRIGRCLQIDSFCLRAQRCLHRIHVGSIYTIHGNTILVTDHVPQSQRTAVQIIGSDQMISGRKDFHHCSDCRHSRRKCQCLCSLFQQSNRLLHFVSGGVAAAGIIISRTLPQSRMRIRRILINGHADGAERILSLITSLDTYGLCCKCHLFLLLCLCILYYSLYISYCSSRYSIYLS